MRRRSGGRSDTQRIIPSPFLPALFLFLCIAGGCSGVESRSRPPVGVGPLRFQQLYSPGSSVASDVGEFFIDATPVTLEAFASFISRHPEWQPGEAPIVLADRRYLASWNGAMPPAEHPDAPVTEVSYFAATAFCSEQGGRLPSTIEWEAAGAASETKRDASRDPASIQRILEWYVKPPSFGLRGVASGEPNYWGIYDLHGMIWEWTSDFNSVFVAPDNRRDGEPLPNLFCGAGSSAASDRANYAAFMRYAFRSSLRGNYSLPTLGFRCAYDKR